MLPRLEAKRELANVNAMSVAFGGGTPAERRRYIAQLRKQARGGEGAPKPSAAVLAAMGIGVVVQEQADG